MFSIAHLAKEYIQRELSSNCFSNARLQLPLCIKLWARYEEPKEEVVQENEVLERKITYKTVVITEVTPELHVFAQNTETGKYSQSKAVCEVTLE